MRLSLQPPAESFCMRQLIANAAQSFKPPSSWTVPPPKKKLCTSKVIIRYFLDMIWVHSQGNRYFKLTQIIRWNSSRCYQLLQKPQTHRFTKTFQCTASRTSQSSVPTVDINGACCWVLPCPGCISIPEFCKRGKSFFRSQVNTDVPTIRLP